MERARDDDSDCECLDDDSNTGFTRNIFTDSDSRTKTLQAISEVELHKSSADQVFGQDFKKFLGTQDVYIGKRNNDNDLRRSYTLPDGRLLFRSLTEGSCGVNDQYESKLPICQSQGNDEDRIEEFSSPLLKDHFKPGRIRKTRQHFEKSRARRFCSSDAIFRTTFNGFSSCDENEEIDLEQENEKTMSDDDMDFSERFSRKKSRNSLGSTGSMEEEMKELSLSQVDLRSDNSRPIFSFPSEPVDQKTPSPPKLSLFGTTDTTKSLSLSYNTGISTSCQTIDTFSTPTRGELFELMGSLDVSRQVLHLTKVVGIKVFAVDFDKTLLSIHTRGVWHKSAVELSNFVRPVFKVLISELLKAKITIAVVTFSRQAEIVERVINLTFKEAKLGKNILICTGPEASMRVASTDSEKILRKFGTQLSVRSFFQPVVNSSGTGGNGLARSLSCIDADHAGLDGFEGEDQGCGKCDHIQKVLDQVNKKISRKIRLKQVCLVDDDLRNVKCCEANHPEVKKFWFRGELNEIEAETIFLNEVLTVK